MIRPIVICDIDGVIADCTARLVHIQGETKDWNAFFDACTDDAPLENMIRLLHCLNARWSIVYITGRPERIHGKTVEWFAKHDLPTGLLLMRKDGDHRPDHEVKRELFQKNYANYPVICVFEDRDQVVEMWRNLGFLCLQPKKGDY